jgi:hypothetical protein
MIKKIIISTVSLAVVACGLYLTFTYRENLKNDLKNFNDLAPVDTEPKDSSPTSTTLTGIIGSNKPLMGKVFFGSLEIEITKPSFSTVEISPGYYSITVQDSEGKSYLTSPTNVQIFPGKNDIKISVFN